MRKRAGLKHAFKKHTVSQSSNQSASHPIIQSANQFITTNLVCRYAGQVAGIVVCHISSASVAAEELVVHGPKIGGPGGIVVPVCVERSKARC